MVILQRLISAVGIRRRHLTAAAASELDHAVPGWAPANCLRTLAEPAAP